jgi:hypothetical protein
MKKKSVGLLELEMGVLECFLEKTPLSPLGVKINNILSLHKLSKFNILINLEKNQRLKIFYFKNKNNKNNKILLMDIMVKNILVWMNIIILNI